MSFPHYHAGTFQHLHQPNQPGLSAIWYCTFCHSIIRTARQAMRRVVYMRYFLSQHTLPSQLEHALGFVTEQMYYYSLQKLVRISSVTICDPRPKHQGIMAALVTGCHRYRHTVISSTVCVLNMSLGCFWPKQKTNRHMQSNTFSTVTIKATKKSQFFWATLRLLT